MRVPQRGRAILRRLNSTDTVRAYRPGDFLLTTSSCGLARLVGWATGSRLNHVALILDPSGTVAEANPSLLADPRAFRLTSVAEYLRAGQPCWIGYVEFREGTRQEVLAYAEHLLRSRCVVSPLGRLCLALHTVISVAPQSLAARYSWLRALHDLLSRSSVVLREDYCFSSAEFVARALERGGFIWESDPAHVTPAELYERYCPRDEATWRTPTLITQKRRTSATSARSAPSLASPSATAGNISRFVRGGTHGNIALAEAQHLPESAQEGMKALFQVGVLVAAGLTFIGVLEEVIRLGHMEG
jgi:hypothetical protein